MSELLASDLFEGRSRNHWAPKPIPPGVLGAIYDLARMGPTSMNCQPARFLFIISEQEKARLAPHLMEGNRLKALGAPCVAIIAHDPLFYEHLPRIFPIREGMREMFAGNNSLTEVTAFRNGTLQGAYFMIAARALGLDCGPMSGFNNASVDQEFFAETGYRSNFICALGYADDTPFPRLPRLPFADACSVI
ncbi:malonic semialdehyde reductase [Bradyrhizobium canariense]|uniref:malonic semialdehyde reductase n=1 Tax=Bradyrhizobium canariense TaxID=255045 RepID=UPI001CA5AF77|nr:malonic semialdehyde reductase [Bradyrhizobium canariense]